MNRTNALSLFGSQPWAVLPSVLAEMRTRILALPEFFTESDIVPQAARPAQRGAGNIGVIPIRGVITQRPSLFSMIFGGSTTEGITAQLQGMVADPSLSGIVLDIDSPGGEVFGIPELGDAIYAARDQKPIIAVADSTAASAAYWLGSQAHEFLVTPSSLTGSIGVIYEHVDVSGAMEQMGVKVTYISAGKYKTEGWEPLTDEATAALQAICDDYYGMFLAAVARGRGAKANDVKGGYGEGRVATAKNAVTLGLADRVGTFADALARISNPRIPLGNRAEALEYPLSAIDQRGVEIMKALGEGIARATPNIASAITDVLDPTPEPIPEPPEPEPIPVPAGRSNASYQALARALTN